MLRPAYSAGLMLLLACALMRAGTVIRDPPYRIDPALTPAANGSTVVLWRFDEPAPRDQTLGQNHGQILGRLAAGAGRFGNGIELAGADAGIMLRKMAAGGVPSAGKLAVDFWCRVPHFPEHPACLLDMPRELGVRVELLPQGQLRVSGFQLEPVTSTATVPRDTWFHLAVLHQQFVQPNHIYDDAAGLMVLLNGAVAAVAWQEAVWRPVPDTAPVYLVLGNDQQRQSGLVGSLDELRVSRGIAGFYELVEQPFLRPDDVDLPARSSRHFRAPERQVFGHGLAELRGIEPPAAIAPIVTAPPVIAPATATITRTATDDDVLGELADELAAAGGESQQPQALTTTPGVRGRALTVRGGAARLDLPAGLDLGECSIEFWFKPEDWDNLAVAPVRGENWNYRNRRPELLTLWGKPTDDGTAVPLLTLQVDRADGGLPVKPEWAAHFARPQVTIAPHRWRHVLLTRSQRFPHLTTCLFDGRPWGSAKWAESETWATHKPSYLTIGNGYATSFDELRVYNSAFEGAERWNARTPTDEQRKPLDTADEPQPFVSLGELPVAHHDDPGFSRISGGWRNGWLPGVAGNGPARVFFGPRPTLAKLIVALAQTDGEAATRATVSLHLAPDQLVSGEIPALSEGKGGVLLSVGDLPSGDYLVRGQLFAGERELGAFDSVYRYQRPDWLGNRLGLSETPPPPFTPMAVEADAITTVGRSHRLGADGNWRGLTILGEEILAAPIHFAVTVDGRQSELTGSGSEPVVTAIGSDWQAAASGAGLTIQSSAHMEFDGTARYQLAIAPNADAVTIDRLTLRIPLRDRYARLLHVLAFNGNWRDYVTAGELPPTPGLLWDSKTWSESVPGVTKRPVGNLVPMIWLGGTTRGLVWFADNDCGWIPSNEQPAATIARHDDVVTLEINFIAGPALIDRPRRITYGLLATPPKPLPQDYRLWNRGHTDTVGGVGGRLTSCDAFAPWVVPVVDRRVDDFAYWPPADDWDFAARAAAAQRVSGHGKYPPGVALMLYHDAAKDPVHASALAAYKWLWRVRSHPSDRIDHLLWYLDKWFTHGMDGVYIDDTFPVADWNPLPVGTAYFISPDGHRYATLDDDPFDLISSTRPGEAEPLKQAGTENFAYRDYLKRLYTRLHEIGKPPLITTHMTDALVWPFHAFATVIFDGEHSGRGHGRNKTYIDAWPIDYFETIHNPERSGLITVPFGFPAQADLDEATPAWQYVMARSYYAMQLLMDHATTWTDDFGGRYYGSNIKVFPFWRNADAVQVRAKLNEPISERDLPVKNWWGRISDHVRQSLKTAPLRVTLYRAENSILVVTVNLIRRPLDCELLLDLPVLGLPDAAGAAFTAVDVDEWLPPDDLDLTSLHLADLQRHPPAPDAAAPKPGALLQRNNVGELDELEEAGADRRRFLAIQLTENRLQLRVAPHNFRAIELRWQSEK